MNLSLYDNSWYSPGAGVAKRTLWYLVNAVVFECPLCISSRVKRALLRWFGARVGKGLVIKPCVNIKYPWRLSVGDNVWIGENVWIDNLGQVSIGSNVCISQGAMLLCGNHNYKKESFDLMVGDITLEDGAWVGARSVVCPGVTLHTHSVLSVGSVACHDLEAFSVYQGTPARKVRERRETE